MNQDSGGIGFKGKIKAIIKILFCKSYIIISENKSGGKDFYLQMNNFEIRRNCLFLYNFLTESDSAIDEANEILNETP